jgi:aspartate/glutamate/glutamine transport system permease protein
VLYIELMRALPSYLIIFFAFIGLPVIFRDVPGMGWLAALDALWYAVIGLTIYTSAVMAEIVRAGILSVEKGQLEAAYSLGLNPIATLRQIVLPQALRRMAPNIVSQLITLTKDTSLASIIALQDLTRKGKQLYQQQANVIETMLIVGLIYFVICYSLALLSKRLEIKSKK